MKGTRTKFELKELEKCLICCKPAPKYNTGNINGVTSLIRQCDRCCGGGKALHFFAPVPFGCLFYEGNGVPPFNGEKYEVPSGQGVRRG